MSRIIRTGFLLMLTAVFVPAAMTLGCGDSTSPTDDVVADAAVDVVQTDVSDAVVSTDVRPDDTAQDTPEDAFEDVYDAYDVYMDDAVTDTGTDVMPTGLPDTLAITVVRDDVGDPIPAAEVTEFTRRLVGYWKNTGYFKYIRDTSYGMHSSTGMRDFQLWWTSVNTFVREGDKVIFGKLTETNGGGHNLMTRTTKVLAGAISAHLMTGLPETAPIVEQKFRVMYPLRPASQKTPQSHQDKSPRRARWSLTELHSITGPTIPSTTFTITRSIF